MNKRAIVLGAITLAFAGLVFAQATVGELLDKGAKKIGKEEWLAMLPITTSGVWPDGKGEAQLTFKPDGTFSGNARHYPSGTSSGAYGTWKVDEVGKVCIDERFYAWPSTHQECTVRFKLGEEFFRAPSDSDRSAGTVKTTLTK